MITLPTTRAGAVAGAHGKQHVDMYRKLILRRKLLATLGPVNGAAYVPFIGDGDIAAELYSDRVIYGADLDPARVATAAARFPQSRIIQADCDGWPFPEIKTKFAIADFDSYSHPYASFLSFWSRAVTAARVLLLFTDGHRQAIKRSGRWHMFDGRHVLIESLPERRQVYNFYYKKFALPWFEHTIGDRWRIVQALSHLRQDMIYWGAVVERT